MSIPLSRARRIAAKKLLAYQKRLQDLPYFSNVVVDNPDPNDAQLTPIKVNVIELPSSNFKGVVGYSTDGGFHAKTQYSHYNVFKRGWIYDIRYDWQQKGAHWTNFADHAAEQKSLSVEFICQSG